MHIVVSIVSYLFGREMIALAIAGEAFLATLLDGVVMLVGIALYDHPQGKRFVHIIASSYFAPVFATVADYCTDRGQMTLSTCFGLLSLGCFCWLLKMFFFPPTQPTEPVSK